MEHIGQIALEAKEWTDKVFGHLATGPALEPDQEGRPGNIHDQWEVTDRSIRAMRPDQRRALAREQLIKYLTWPTEVAWVVREHRAVARFGPDGTPLNEEAQTIAAVIDGLLDDEAVIAEVLDIRRGWPAVAQPRTGDIWIQVFRAREPRQNQRDLWRKAQTFVHEYLHLLEHRQYQDYRKGLGFGTHAHNALVEGVACLLTEIVWSGVPVADPAVRSVVEREYASEPPLQPGEMPHPRDDRYASLAEVMRLLHVVGDVRNLYAAFFLGDVEKITGPVSVAVMGSPSAPLPAGEADALVARLNAMPEAEREQLRISVFTDALPEVIEDLLAEPGADVLTVTTAESGYQPAWDRAVRRLHKATRSGFYIPADPSEAADLQADELTAARSFPRVDGATVLHVHFRSGAFAADGRRLTPQQFQDQVVDPLGLPPGQPLILVGCQTAAGAQTPGSVPAVSALSMLSKRPVIGATADAFTTTAAQVVTAAHAGFDADGRPVLDASRPGDWVAAWPDGRTVAGLGADLLAILRSGTLTAFLPGVGLGEGEPTASPARTVMWAKDLLSGAVDARSAGQLSSAALARRSLRPDGSPSLPAVSEEPERQRTDALEEQVRRYRAGIGVNDWTAEQREEATGELLAGSLSAVHAALALISAESDPGLARLFGDGWLFADLNRAIPADHPLRADLERFIAERFAGGWTALETGRVEPVGQPDGTFNPSQISPDLPGLSDGAAPAGEQLAAVAAALAALPATAVARVGRELVRLPLPQRAVAASWLAAVRVALMRPASGTEGSERLAADRLGRLLTALRRSIAGHYVEFGSAGDVPLGRPAGQAPGWTQDPASGGAPIARMNLAGNPRGGRPANAGQLVAQMNYLALQPVAEPRLTPSDLSSASTGVAEKIRRVLARRATPDAPPPAQAVADLEAMERTGAALAAMRQREQQLYQEYLGAVQQLTPVAGLDRQRAAATRWNAFTSNAEAASRAAHAEALSELPQARSGAGTDGQAGSSSVGGIRQTLEDAYRRAEQAAAAAETEEAAAQAFDASVQASLAALDGRIASLALTSAVGGALAEQAQRLRLVLETSPVQESSDSGWETAWERGPDGRFHMVRRSAEPGSARQFG